MSWPHIYSTGVIAFFNSLNLEDYAYVFIGGVGPFVIFVVKFISVEFGDY